jgi:hypothetical protein
LSLHLCYRLLLPGETKVDEVRSMISALKNFADTLEFEKVLGPAEYTTDDLDEISEVPDIGKIIVSTMCGDPPDFYGVGFGGEPCAITFAIGPRGECDPAILGLIAPGSRSDAGLPEDDLHPGEWFWSGACQTWRVGLTTEEDFLRYHIGLVRLLDHARALGMSVEVDDEAGYWESRSREKVLDLIRQSAMQEKLAHEQYLRWLETHPGADEEDSFGDDAAVEFSLGEEQADGSGTR